MNNNKNLSLLDALQDELANMDTFERENLGDFRSRLQSMPNRGVGGISRTPSMDAQIIRINTEERAVAQFDITAKRLTANIPQDLPFVLFGFLDFQSSYNGILNTLASGLTLVVDGGVHDGQPEKVRFIFTDAFANTDTIEITCNQTSYPTFLFGTSDDYFRLFKIRYSISDVLAQDQFAKECKVINRTMFGLKNENSISITASKSPEQFQSTIVDLNYEIEVDKQTNIKHILRQQANFSVTFSMFVEKFNRRAGSDLRKK